MQIIRYSDHNSDELWSPIHLPLHRNDRNGGATRSSTNFDLLFSQKEQVIGVFLSNSDTNVIKTATHFCTCNGRYAAVVRASWLRQTGAAARPIWDIRLHARALEQQLKIYTVKSGALSYEISDR